eukprot:Pgem_evm1s19033
MTALDIFLDWILPSISVIFASAVYSSSIPFLFRSKRDNRPDPLNPLIFVASFGFALGWLVWSIEKEIPNEFLMFSSFYGLLVTIWCGKVTYNLCTSRKLKFICEFCVFLTIFLWFAYYNIGRYIPDPNTRELFLGLVANFHTLFFFGAPMVMYPRSKNYIYTAKEIMEGKLSNNKHNVNNLSSNDSDPNKMMVLHSDDCMVKRLDTTSNDKIDNINTNHTHTSLKSDSSVLFNSKDNTDYDSNGELIVDLNLKQSCSLEKKFEDDLRKQIKEMQMNANINI